MIWQMKQIIKNYLNIQINKIQKNRQYEKFQQKKDKVQKNFLNVFKIQFLKKKNNKEI